MNRIDLFSIFIPLLGFLLASHVDPSPVRFFQTPTIPFNWNNLQGDTLYFRDSLSGQQFYQFRSDQGIPLFYGQEISTEVCFESKCRPLLVTVYWNITGRYLGYMLAEDEFLSRRDHDPFTVEDYEQLNLLLSDPFLPFAGISFEELIQPPDADSRDVDGVSGATSKNISSFVIAGAAYTTYSLWNAIYGPVQNRISEYTESQLTSSLLTLILRSSTSEDKVWGLKKIHKIKQLDAKVEEEILEIIAGDDFFAAHTAINELQPDHLVSETLQVGLISKYQEINPNLGKPILQKLQAVPIISQMAIEQTRGYLSKLNGVQLGNVLRLYEAHGISDLKTIQSVAKILNHKNPFVAGKAYDFLKNLMVNDADVNQTIKAYEANK